VFITGFPDIPAETLDGYQRTQFSTGWIFITKEEINIERNEGVRSLLSDVFLF